MKDIGLVQVRPTAELRPHLLGGFVPDMLPNEFAKLLAAVRAEADDASPNGNVREPLTILSNGVILDGRHRYRAAKELGILMVPVFVVAIGEEDPVEYIYRTAATRRDLNADQHGQLALYMGSHRQLRAEAAKLKLDGASKGGKAKAAALRSGNAAGTHTQPAHLPAAKRAAAARETRTALAAEAGISPRTMQKAITVAKLAESNPRIAKMLPEIRAGRCSTDDALKLVKLEAKHALADVLRGEPLPMVSGPFRVIVADPPWRYEKRAEDISHRGRNPYPDMSVEEICALPVKDLAVDDAVLWLWTTNAFMRDAFRVLDAWGFTERTILTWVKDRMGTGDWLRGKSEHCILAIRGKPIVTLTNETTVLAAPLREHSRKPDEFFALVDKLCPGTKVELFAREPRAGWAAWGAEIDRFEASA